MLEYVSTTALAGALAAFDIWAFRRLKNKSLELDCVHSAQAADKAKSIAKEVSGDQAFLSDSNNFFGFEEIKQPLQWLQPLQLLEAKSEEIEKPEKLEKPFVGEKNPEALKLTALAWEEKAAGEAKPAGARDDAGNAFEEKISVLSKKITETKEEMEKEIEDVKSIVSKRVFTEELKHRIAGIEKQVSQLGKLAANCLSEIEDLKSKTAKAFAPENLSIVRSESVKLKRIPKELESLKRRKKTLEKELKALKYSYMKGAVLRQTFQKKWNAKQRALQETLAKAMRFIEQSPRRTKR